jgi:hypothetical protein
MGEQCIVREFLTEPVHSVNVDGSPFGEWTPGDEEDGRDAQALEHRQPELHLTPQSIVEGD